MARWTVAIRLPAVVWIALGIALLGAAPAPSPPEPAPHGRIAGTVLHADGTPADFVDVLVEDEGPEHHGFTELTDAQGAFIFDSIPVGTYRLSAFLPGHASDLIEHVQVEAGSAQSFVLRLTHLDETVAVSVGGALLDVPTAALQDYKVISGLYAAQVGYRLHGASDQLGLRNRRIQDVVMLYPGVASPGSSPTASSHERYAHVPESGFIEVADRPLSTFSVDVDTASYSNVRRYLEQGLAPPPDAVRIEELLNAFRYDYPQPRAGRSVAAFTEVSDCPWSPAHRLLHVGLAARAIETGGTPPRNLVFLVDVSGSMRPPDKLPLLVQGLGLLVDDLRGEDSVALVVYAGAAGVVLPSTRGSDHEAIRTALGRLESGGSTNGGEGIQEAYRLAREAFIEGGVNRVILATDGDFNVGLTSDGALVRLIEEQAKGGVFLTVLGFGAQGINDSLMERLADHGNGNYAYIDGLDEARKVLVRESGTTLVTVAKDVKLQLEFNPREVVSYRLIGYENRRLDDADFNDDAKDAGDMGSGGTVTALYEFVPAAGRAPAPGIDELRYQEPRALAPAAAQGELATLKLRAKEPGAARSRRDTLAVVDDGAGLAAASDDFRFAAAVALFGMLLRDSPHARGLSQADVLELARAAQGADPHGDRAGFVRLAERAAALAARTSSESVSESESGDD